VNVQKNTMYKHFSIISMKALFVLINYVINYKPKNLLATCKQMFTNLVCEIRKHYYFMWLFFIYLFDSKANIFYFLLN